MPTHLRRKLKIVAAWTGIALAGVAAGIWSYRGLEVRMLARLIDDAERSAVAFDAAELRNLSGTHADLTTPAYATVKARLRKLVAVDPSVRQRVFTKGTCTRRWRRRRDDRGPRPCAR